MSYDDYSKLKALVIGDFDNFRTALCKMLHKLGIERVDTAMNSFQAVNACQAECYGLIVCDYDLGSGEDGQRVLEELRDKKILRHSSLFVLLSSETSRSIIMATCDDEPDAYLTKPINSKTLERHVNSLLSQRDELLPIYNALDNEDTAKAIVLCWESLEREGRHTSLCQKLLGELYLEVGAYELAEKLYRKVLEVRALDWAQVGLAKVKQAQGDLAAADEWLRNIIDSNPFCMQAYDALAKSCQLRDDSLALQKIMQQVVAVSPMSIRRQQSLAEVAAANNEWKVAAHAYRRTVRLGRHSCRDRVENHLNFGRTTAALLKQDRDNPQAYQLSHAALRVLTNIEQRFDPVPDLLVQARLIESQVLAGQGDQTKAEQTLQEVEQQLKTFQPSLSVDSELDHVTALAAVGRESQSKALLDSLTQRYRKDQGALKKIDRQLEEPLSEHNQQRVARINHDGIELYEAKRFREAIDCFRQAKCLFPNHIGVNLNLVQALLGEMVEYGQDSKLMELCLATMKKIECRIDTSHVQYGRYLQLQDKAKLLMQSRGKANVDP